MYPFLNLYNTSNELKSNLELSIRLGLLASTLLQPLLMSQQNFIAAKREGDNDALHKHARILREKKKEWWH